MSRRPAHVALQILVGAVASVAGTTGSLAQEACTVSQRITPDMRPEVDTFDVARAKAVISRWGGDFILLRRGRALPDSFEASLRVDLRHALGPRLGNVLLAIALEPQDVERDFRVTPLPSAALHFYTAMGCPSEVLDEILASHAVDLRLGAMLFAALSASERRARQVSPARRGFVYTLAHRLDTGSGDYGYLQRLTAHIIEVLEFEDREGSRAARDLLNEPLVAAAASRLRREGLLRYPSYSTVTRQDTCIRLSSSHARSTRKTALNRLLPSVLGPAQKLGEYSETSAVLASGDTVILLVSAVEGWADLAVVAIALRNCLWYGGLRNVGLQVTNSQASEPWNRVLRAQAGNIVLGSVDDVRDLAHLYLAFATGYSQDSRWVLSDAIYKTEGLWEITGKAALGREYSFVMRLNTNGTVVDLWLTPR